MLLLGKIHILNDKVIIQNGSQEEISAYNVNQSDCNFEQECINSTPNMVKELKNAGVKKMNICQVSIQFQLYKIKEYLGTK